MFDTLEEKRFLLKQLVKRDLTSNYKDSILGVIWSFLHPLCLMIIFTVIFSVFFRRQIQNYPVFYLSARVIYQFFIASTNSSMASIRSNSGILKQIYVHLNELFGELNVSELNNEIIKRTNKENNIYSDTINSLEQEKNKIFKSIELLYNDRIDGTLSADSYKLLSNNYEIKLKEINKKIEDINIKIINNKLNSSTIHDYTKQINKLLNIKNPNRDLLFTLIEKIEADKDRNIYINFRHKIIPDLMFKYKDENKVRNPYGRNGKRDSLV